MNFLLTYQLQHPLQLIRLKDMVIMQLEYFILFNFLFCIPHDRKRSFTERVLKVLTAHQTALRKGEILKKKKAALSKVFSSCDFIKGLSGSYQALLTISIIPKTVSSET